jgi:hypothetical protein
MLIMQDIVISIASSSDEEGGVKGRQPLSEQENDLDGQLPNWILKAGRVPGTASSPPIKDKEYEESQEIIGHLELRRRSERLRAESAGRSNCAASSAVIEIDQTDAQKFKVHSRTSSRLGVVLSEHPLGADSARTSSSRLVVVLIVLGQVVVG